MIYKVKTVSSIASVQAVLDLYAIGNWWDILSQKMVCIV